MNARETETMTEETLLALSKFDAKNRSKVEAGTHEIDELVRIVGTMKVQEDHEANITAAIPWQKLAAVLFSKLNGVTVEAVVKEALAEDLDTKNLTKKAQSAMDEIVGSSKAPRKGAVKLDVEVQAVIETIDELAG